MRWWILGFPLLAVALPQQKETRPRSPFVQARSSATNSTKGPVWSFNPDYNPHARVVESEISGPYYSRQNWEFRKVGEWLVEYAALHKIADSDNFFVALYETDAFGRDNQEVCGLTPAGDNCNGGQVFNGVETPYRFTNDEFNAQMVRQAIRNTWVYYRTFWSAIGDAAQEVSPLVGQMVMDLEKPPSIKPSGFMKALDVLGGFIQFVGVFFPAEDILATVAEDLVKTELKTAQAGSVFFQVSEEGAEKLVTATKKELTTGYGKIKDTYASGKVLIGKLAAALDDPASGDPVGDAFNYQADADQYGRDAQQFLENTWNAMLNNGFSDGGLISQIFTGDILDINAQSLGATNDHGSASYNDAKQQYFNYLMQRTMTQILRDHGVRVVKRGSYSSQDSCMYAYQDTGYQWVPDWAQGCFADPDNPDQFSQYFAMVGDSNGHGKNAYVGARALFGSSWGDYQFDGQAFYQGATACTKSNGLWENADAKIEVEWTPQYSPGRVPDGTSQSTSQSLDASQLVCAYSAPTCDFEDPAYISACEAYKSKMRDRVFQLADEAQVDLWDSDSDTGPCGDRELLEFCLLALQQGPDESLSFNHIANNYVSYLDAWDGRKTWGGLAGFEIQMEVGGFTYGPFGGG